MEQNQLKNCIREFNGMSRGVMRFSLKDESSSRIISKKSRLSVENQKFIIKNLTGKIVNEFEVDQIERVWFLPN